MIVGYARTSTVSQMAGIEAQLCKLKDVGAEKIFHEHVSSTDTKRPQLEAAIDFMREGDVLVVTALDRLMRNVSHFIEIEARLSKKNIHLRVLTPNIDTSCSTGRFMLNAMASVAQFEREVMLERQREGIAKAKAEGKYKGRAPTARAKADEIRKLKAEGKSAIEIAKQLSVSRSSVYRVSERSVYRILAEQRKPGVKGNEAVDNALRP